MICKNLLNLTGFACQPISEQGDLARISTPFCFADGDPVPVYVQAFANNVHRFFDDGQTLLHFIGRGMELNNGHKLRFVSNIAQKHGAAMNDNGVLELFSKGDSPSGAFAQYITCMIAISQWEHEHQGLDAGAAAFADEVAHALLNLFPASANTFMSKPVYLGSSGKRHELDFSFNGKGYIAVRPNQQSAAPALYKLVDITNRQTNEDAKLVVVIDDRHDKTAAKNTKQVFRSIASDVISFTKIATQSHTFMH
ncbi:DUF1828 domain-containing protein [Comamonas terrigena]|uniref:DUF1828 domain-containing protein n=1 Tax=Comamonas terrigena TaxID=32013 RepID=UPI002353E738|nr:DUF1828 domain-containing protein [Comamonas terrigena]